MRYITIPPNAAAQGQRLVGAGIADRVLLTVKKKPGYEALTVDECRFWTRVLAHDDEIREPQWQVVVSYPSRLESDSVSRLADGITVETKNSPWLLADGDTLSPEQLELVRQLAGTAN
ncbi:hypothetical protein [Streptomyces nanshensis]|uniref:Uncharacterized protein n=1 Tax=Streptomyces nanshensis TaxID=518642 RepID=A0A1E7LBL6_9ACTN|nr:hypothetical protein [Streptomyces nanshensis]OEV13622.1 hypothetical protein AN218_02650 [Streptomyces nanshensis]